MSYGKLIGHTTVVLVFSPCHHRARDSLTLQTEETIRIEDQQDLFQAEVHIK